MGNPAVGPSLWHANTISPRQTGLSLAARTELQNVSTLARVRNSRGEWDGVKIYFRTRRELPVWFPALLRFLNWEEPHSPADAIPYIVLGREIRCRG